MPIRSRISDPFSDSVKKFERRVKEGAPPVAPPKPSLKERCKFVEALERVPVGTTFHTTKFFRTIADKYMVERYQIWGQILYILPAYKLLIDKNVECTGASVGRHNANKRGIKPMLRLNGPTKTWYSQTLHWIEDTVYD